MLACGQTLARFATLVEPIDIGAIAYHPDANGLIAAWCWIFLGGARAHRWKLPSNLGFP
jgi:hypothetical protein